MAVIRIFEMLRVPEQGGDIAPIYPSRWHNQQSVVIGASSTQSTAFAVNGAGDSPAVVAIQADAACHVAIGPDPTATTDDFKIQSGETIPFTARRADKVAVIQA